MSPAFATTLFPLIAALLYAFGALVLKRSSDLGVGLYRTTFVANLIVAGLFSFLWLLGGPPVEKELIWQPGLIAMCLFVGQISQFLALEKGDVSVAVPVFGLKVILVAFFTPLLIGEAVSVKLWIAAFLSVIGITFLNRKDADQPPRHLLVTFIAGGTGAVAFAVFDVLVQKWGPTWGVGRLLPCIFWINALLSFGLIFRFSAPLSAIRAQAWPWLAGGSALFGIQSITFVSTLAVFGKATSANIVYASRGLLSVVLVWAIGHWFKNAEQHLGPKVMRWRLAGALLMMSAIVLVVV
ncbi:DMT family transporter [Prosthecobacter sp.]|uniref:DMT family transporter n=1 Tax=Prosthecobacter sp. TaxID=1965333 RepID=UPI001D27CF34|nr:DMT family transporter [Prosthecobacter sp.]MCB1275530.1 DMT family transporter [Prosthecobacter sp.]